MNLFSGIRKRLGVQLLLAITFVSMAPLVGTGLLLLSQTESSLRAEVQSHQEQAAEISANLVRDYLRNAREKLEIIALFLSKQSYENPEQLTAALKPRLEAAGIFLDLNYYHTSRGKGPGKAYFNATQEEYQAVQRMTGGENFLDPRVNPKVYETPFFREASAGTPHVSSRVETTGDIPFVTLSVPVERKAVLVANLDFRPVRALLRNVAGENRVIQLFGAEGVLSSSGPIAESDRIETDRSVDHGDWRVRVSEAKSRAFAPLRRARLHSTLWIAAAAAFSLALSWFLSRRILRPVRKLTATAERVEGGELDARTGIVREDEIGDLARSFDRMTESLQQLDRLKSDFVAHVSHELRTPLTSAKLSLANLEEEVLGPMTDRQKTVAARIGIDMDRLILMVNELLDIARLEAGGGELDRRTVDLAEVISAALDTLRPLAHPRGIELRWTPVPLTLEGDPARLEQVVLNLVDNAIKVSPDGGAVSIRIEGRDLVVEDEGPGLPDDGEHLFEKFAPRTTGDRGVGLGLSITKKLVELHGGTVRGENRPGRGARFTVRFP